MQGEVKEYLIRKDGYFYRPNCQGYTTRKIEAGRYTKTKAEAEVAVEPWHMSVVHQDDVPDEPAVADLNAEIARLQEQVEALTKERGYEREKYNTALKCYERAISRAEAAEAERDRLRATVTRVTDLLDSYEDRFSPPHTIVEREIGILDTCANIRMAIAGTHDPAALNGGSDHG